MDTMFCVMSKNENMHYSANIHSLVLYDFLLWKLIKLFYIRCVLDSLQCIKVFF